MRQGLSYFHSTIFTSLPLFYRRIDTALKQVRPLQKPAVCCDKARLMCSPAPGEISHPSSDYQLLVLHH